ncbi:uncharacterized protein NPIL_693851, partial [Nephila pilipes]
VLPSSTPIQSHNDSGYFGSNNKSSLAKIVHMLSPVKEHSAKKRLIHQYEFEKLYNSDITTGTVISTKNLWNDFHSCKLVKELDFNNSSGFDENFKDSFNESQDISLLLDLENSILSCETKSTSSSQEHKDSNSAFFRDIFKKKIQFSSENSHRKRTNKNIDFFKELDRMNCQSIIRYILSLLSAEDLTQVCYVSRKWREILLCDNKANSRRKEFLKDRILHK